MGARLAPLATRDDVLGPPLEECDDVVDGAAVEKLHPLRRLVCGVWSEDYLPARQDRMIRWQRLRVEDVERRTRQMARVQRLDQRRGVHQVSPAAVDQDGARLHPGQLFGPDYVPCLVAEPDMEADDVRLLEEGVEVDEPHA